MREKRSGVVCLKQAMGWKTDSEQEGLRALDILICLFDRPDIHDVRSSIRVSIRLTTYLAVMDLYPCEKWHLGRSLASGYRSQLRLHPVYLIRGANKVLHPQFQKDDRPNSDNHMRFDKARRG